MPAQANTSISWYGSGGVRKSGVRAYPAAMRFDDVYRDTPAVFGAEPEPSLLRHLPHIRRDLPTLDVGAGQGRNALPLARGGLAVDALEPSAEAAGALRRLAASEGLPLRVHSESFARFVGDARGYGAILLFGLMPLLSWCDIDRLVGQVRAWTRPASLVFVTAFTSADPGLPRIAASWQSDGDRSFVGPDGDRRTYLLPGQLPSLFPGFATVRLWEGLGPEHHHGDGELERHGLVEAVLAREPSD